MYLKHEDACVYGWKQNLEITNKLVTHYINCDGFYSVHTNQLCFYWFLYCSIYRLQETNSFHLKLCYKVADDA